MSTLLQIRRDVPYLSEDELEVRADGLLAGFEREDGPVDRLPVPVEAIVDFGLGLGIEWWPISDRAGSPILAYLDPARQLIRVNEAQRHLFDRYRGLYEYTLAHEAGHRILHVTAVAPPPSPLGEGTDTLAGGVPQLCRARAPRDDRREVQAQIFAAYLLMPRRLVLREVAGRDLGRRQTLVDLGAAWHVSLTALTIRLGSLGLLRSSASGRPIASREEALQQRLW
jgi:hypothetical protein